MSLCDPARNRPVPSTGELTFPEASQREIERAPFMPVKCDRCGHTHNLHGSCLDNLEHEALLELDRIRRPRTEQLPGQPKFNSLHISRLLIKVDGHSETLFIAILNGNAVGHVIGMIQPWKACGLRMLFVTPKHRHMGIGIRLVRDVEAWAKEQGANSIEIAVHKGNVEGRTFWIRRRFIDDETRDMSDTPEYRCMVKAL